MRPSTKSQILAREQAVTMPADSWVGAKPPAVTMAQARTVIERDARRCAVFFIKARARDYIEERWQLDLLRRGFPASTYTPEQLIEFAKEVLRQEFLLRFPPDHRGEFVPVKKINAKAAILAGRYLRAKANQDETQLERIDRLIAEERSRNGHQ